MGTKRNLTVQLDAEIIRKARVLAVQRSTSVSRLVAEQLEHLVNDEDRYRKAEQVALADLDTGFHLGGGELPPRAELHER
jgi:predicted transcriptional regulator